MKTIKELEKEAMDRRKKNEKNKKQKEENPFSNTFNFIKAKTPPKILKQNYPVLRKVFVPKRYKKAKISDYDFKDEILNKYLKVFKKATDYGRGLNLLGINGNGKTRFIHALIREYILLNSDEYFEECKKEALVVKFVEVRKQCIRWIKEPEKIDKYFNEIKKVDFLVIDDFLKLDITEMQLAFILDVLDYRYENVKTTILTSNLSEAEMIEKGGLTLWDRVGNINYTLEITEESLRPKYDNFNLSLLENK